MRTVFLNCSEKNFCTSLTGDEDLTIIKYYVATFIYGIGVINNYFCCYLFFTVKEMRTPYNRFLKIYSINSFIINLNNLIYTITIFSCTNTVYTLQNHLHHFENRLIAFIFTHITFPVWAFLYSMTLIIEIFIVYNRTLFFYPYVTFLKYTNVYK